MTRETTRLVTLLSILALLLLGCGNEPLGIEDGARKPTSVEPSRRFLELTLDPFHPAVEAGGSIRLTACWRSSSGACVWPVTSPWKVTWVTEHPEIAEVTEDGLVKARSRGLATIRVTVTYATGGQWGHTYTVSGSTPVVVK